MLVCSYTVYLAIIRLSSISFSAPEMIMTGSVIACGHVARLLGDIGRRSKEKFIYYSLLCAATSSAATDYWKASP